MRFWQACKDSVKIQVNFQRHWKIDKLEKCDRDTSHSDFRPNLRKKTFHNLVILEKTDICSGFLTSQLMQKIVRKIKWLTTNVLTSCTLILWCFFMSAPVWVWMWQRQEAALRLINLKNANYSVIDVSKYAKSFAHYHPVMLLRDILRKTNEWKDKETTVKQQCRSRSESLLESRVTCVRWNLWNLIRIFEISSESSESH